MADVRNYTVEGKISSLDYELITSGLAMLRVSSLRAISKEPDAGIRDAREKRAQAIKALEVKLQSALKEVK